MFVFGSVILHLDRLCFPIRLYVFAFRLSLLAFVDCRVRLAQIFWNDWFLVSVGTLCDIKQTNCCVCHIAWNNHCTSGIRHVQNNYSWKSTEIYNNVTKFFKLSIDLDTFYVVVFSLKSTIGILLICWWLFDINVVFSY